MLAGALSLRDSSVAGTSHWDVEQGLELVAKTLLDFFFFAFSLEDDGGICNQSLARRKTNSTTSLSLYAQAGARRNVRVKGSQCI